MKHLYHNWTFNPLSVKRNEFYKCARCGKPSATKTRDICPGAKK